MLNLFEFMEMSKTTAHILLSILAWFADSVRNTTLSKETGYKFAKNIVFVKKLILFLFDELFNDLDYTVGKADWSIVLRI